MTFIHRHTHRLAAACIVIGLGLATPAAAQDDGVFVDPNSPSGREYQLPLESARRTADPARSPGGKVKPGERSSPLFGEGIEPSQEGGTGGGGSGSGGSGSGGSGSGGSGRPGSNGGGNGNGGTPATPSPARGGGLGAAVSRPGAPGGGSGTMLLIVGGAAAVLVAGGLAGFAMRRGRRPA